MYIKYVRGQDNKDRHFTLCEEATLIRCENSSDSDQKSIFDHDRLIGLQKSIF